jgi:KDO2-lipid IV(A) lauroyltransferase
MKERVRPPHAPELSALGRRLGRFNISGVFWYRIHALGARVLPEWSLRFFIVFFTSIFFVLLVRIRQALASNLEAVLGPCGWWERQCRVYRTLYQFAWMLTERYEGLETDRRVRSTVRGEEHWRRALAHGSGLILVTAHVGHWEVGTTMAHEDDPRTVNVVREEEVDPESQEYLRERFATRLDPNVKMHFAHDDPMLGMKMLMALRKGELVALQGDRPRTGGRFFEASLFGRPMPLPLGPVALARTADVPLLPVFVLRRGRLCSEIIFRPPIKVDREGGEEALHGVVQQVADEVAAVIREAPYQWFCFRELWPDH